MSEDRLSGVRQCKLRRGDVHKTAWIPERFAKKGNWLRLFDEDGWLVVDTGIWLQDMPIHRGYFAGGVTCQ